MRVTAANTYFTAVLYGYYAHLDSAWWQFLSGTWMEDVIYDGINDYYQYLNCSFSGCFFKTPTQSFNQGSFSLHPFGASIFGHYLTQVHDFGTMRKIWETLNERKPETFTLQDLEAGLPEGGFAKVLPEFAIWNYFTGNRTREGYYEEAGAYPEMPVNNSFPSGSGTVDHLAADYILLNTQERSGNLTATFNLDSTAVWTLKVLLVTSDSVDVLTPTESSVEITDINRYQEVVFIPVVISLEGIGFRYAYNMTIEDLSQQSTPNSDFSGDNKVDFTDFLLFAQNFNKQENQEGFDSKYDLNQDGQVGFQDFLIFASAFNTTSESNGLKTPVAESQVEHFNTNVYSAAKPAIHPTQNR